MSYLKRAASAQYPPGRAWPLFPQSFRLAGAHRTELLLSSGRRRTTFRSLRPRASVAAEVTATQTGDYGLSGQRCRARHKRCGAGRLPDARGGYSGAISPESIKRPATASRAGGRPHVLIFKPVTKCQTTDNAQRAPGGERESRRFRPGGRSEFDHAAVLAEERR